MNELFKALLDNLTFPIWIMDLDFKYIYVNNKYIEGSEGKTEIDFIGKRNEDIFDSDFGRMLSYHCNSVIENKYPKIIEMYFGDELKGWTITPLFNGNRELVGIAGIIGMVSEERKLQEKNTEIEMQKNLTRHIMDLLPGVVFYKDKDSKYVYANAECRDFYRKKGINNILGKTDTDINLDVKLREKFIEDDRRIIEEKETIYNEVTFTLPDGKEEYREVVKMPLVDSSGEVLGIIGRSMDVTKRKVAEERLKYLSYIDILTGIKNRTSFEEQLEVLKDYESSLGVIMGDVNGLKLVNDTLGHQEGDRLLITVAEIMKEVCDNKGKGEVYRIGGDEFAILIPKGRSEDCDEIIREIVKRFNEFEDEKFCVSIALGSSVRSGRDRSLLSVLKEADDNSYKQKLEQQKCIKSSILSILKTSSSTKSIESEEYTERVALNAVRVGKEMGLDSAAILELKIAGEIYDIGKIAINGEVLEKQGKLTDEEFEILKTHAEKGYHLVKASNGFRSIADGVLCHHERWDGKGYPLGLKGEEIPLISRIISVVDAYDVMTNGRVYRKAITQEEAIKELRQCAGTQFDPNVVEAFVQCLR